MILTNTTKSDLGICEGYVAPAGGSIDIPDDVLTSAKASPVVAGWIVDGCLVLAAPVPDDGMAALKAEADRLGIEYGGRIGADTLRERIAAARRDE